MNPAGKISLRAIAELTKLRIAGFSTLSVVTGYAAAAHALRWGTATTCAGVLLLALGACALNQWQDREIDGRMPRTRNRPLPSGRITPGSALFVAAVLLLAGFLLLLVVDGAVPAALGVLAVLWYNGVYTPLKRVWAFAVVPGALVGAVPPAIGWTAAGESIQDPRLLAVCFFFFIWQVPHFWLLLFAYGREYAGAGLPTLTQLFSVSRLARLTFTWMLATAASSLLLPVYGLIGSGYARWALAASGLALAGASLTLLPPDRGRPVFRRAFAAINLYALAVMGLLVLDATV